MGELVALHPPGAIFYPRPEPGAGSWLLILPHHWPALYVLAFARLLVACEFADADPRVRVLSASPGLASALRGSRGGELK